jgi:sugar transferase (PEP-CTERM/EpsH1 system associated)
MEILWLKTELLHPLDKGGKIRTYQMLRELNREHTITYLTLDEDGDIDAVAGAEQYCDSLVRVPFRSARKGTARFYGELARSIVSPLPYAVWKYRSPAMRRRIAELAHERSADLVVCDFLAPAVNVPDGLPLPIVLFQHNVEAMIWKRHASLASSPVRRAFMRLQWRRMQSFERAQCRRFDHVVTVSVDDSDTIQSQYEVERVSDIPTGVDTDYFRPSGTLRPDVGALVFTGSMDWMPNQDAMGWFCEEVLPSIRAECSPATLTIVGRNPSAGVVALAQRHEGVTVAGTVPDVRPYLERAAVYVVPLRVGGGTRLKIFEAMAMERAIVTTSIGAEGLPVHDGEHLLIADSPPAFAAAVARLLADPGYAATLGRRAAALVRAHHGWRGAAAKFADICRDVVERTAYRSPLLPQPS